MAADATDLFCPPPMAPLGVVAQSVAPTVTVRTSAGEWTNAYAFRGTGPNAPLVRVALNPQPEPPGATAVRLASPTRPTLTTAVAAESFRTLVSVSRGGERLSLDSPTIDQTKGLVLFTVRNASGQVAYRISLTIRDAANAKLSPGSLVGLNPQPEPPGDAGAVAYAFGGSFAVAARAGLTVSIIDPKNKPVAVALQPDLPIKAGQTMPIFFALSDVSRTFTASDVTVTGGTLSEFQGYDTNYSALFTPTADSTTPGRIEIAAGTFTNVANAANHAGGLSKPIAIDTLAPTVAVTTVAPKSGSAAGGPLGAGGSLPLVFSLSEPVAGFTIDDVQVTGGRLVDFAGRGTRYTARFVPDAASNTPGLITVPAGVFADLAGNPNTAGGLASPIPVDTRPKTLTVTRDRATIQEAIDAVADGGTVFVPPGLYDVASGPIMIVGKVVNLIGLMGKGSSVRPVIRGQDTPYPSRSIDDAVGLVNYGPGGGGRLENLSLEGGDAGVRGYASRTSGPAGVSFTNLVLRKNGRGVAGTFQNLAVRKCEIAEAALHGVSLKVADVHPNAASVEFANTKIGFCGSFGLRVESVYPSNKPMSVVINNTTIENNGGGGAVLIGPINVQALNSKFLNNAQVGFWCNDIATTQNLFFKCVVSQTYGADNAAKELGHGFCLVGNGSISAGLSQFVSNEGYGIALQGPVGLSLSGSSVSQNKFGIGTFEGAQLTLSSSVVTGNTEDDFMSDAVLPVPGPPQIPPE